MGVSGALGAPQLVSPPVADEDQRWLGSDPRIQLQVAEPLARERIERLILLPKCQEED
jgi:hypothetical protein